MAQSLEAHVQRTVYLALSMGGLYGLIGILTILDAIAPKMADTRSPILFDVTAVLNVLAVGLIDLYLYIRCRPLVKSRYLVPATLILLAIGGMTFQGLYRFLGNAWVQMPPDGRWAFNPDPSLLQLKTSCYVIMSIINSIFDLICGLMIIYAIKTSLGHRSAGVVKGKVGQILRSTQMRLLVGIVVALICGILGATTANSPIQATVTTALSLSKIMLWMTDSCMTVLLPNSPNSHIHVFDTYLRDFDNADLIDSQRTKNSQPRIGVKTDITTSNDAFSTSSSPTASRAAYMSNDMKYVQNSSVVELEDFDDSLKNQHVNLYRS